MSTVRLLVALTSLAAAPYIGAAALMEDSYSWLEPSNGTKAIAWADEQSKRTQEALGSGPLFDQLTREARDAERASNAVGEASPWFDGRYAYRVLITSDHQHGLWQRSTIASYEHGDPRWDLLLDLDELSKAEGRSYSIGSAFTKCNPSGDRCMLALLRDGSELVFAHREYDTTLKRFVTGGFERPLGTTGLGWAIWADNDTLLVSSDFGPGTLQEDGVYPATVRLWHRGESITAARAIFRVPQSASVSRGLALSLPIPVNGRDGAEGFVFAGQRSDGTQHSWLWQNGREPSEISLPEYANVWGATHGNLIVTLSREWNQDRKAIAAGSLLAFQINRPAKAPGFEVLYAPGKGEPTGFPAITDGTVLLSVGAGEKKSLLSFDAVAGTAPRHVRLPAFCASDHPILASPQIKPAFVTCDGPLTPKTTIAVSGAGAARIVSTAPAAFSSSSLEVQHLEARSRDGTSIPYTIVRPRKLPKGGSPTLLAAYGAFGGAPIASYDPVMGRLWLSRGGSFVLAGIRGGNERGSEWHVRGAQRTVVYEDFEAVARDLIKRGLTSPAHLGISGFSAGGLVIGNALNRTPELFRAAVIKSGTLDLLRLDLTHGGKGEATLAGEFGHENVPAELAVMRATSPFQNLQPRRSFPTPLILTSRTDEIVRPANGRRYARKLQDLGMAYYYFESLEGGHSIMVDADQIIQQQALTYAYLISMLMGRK